MCSTGMLAFVLALAISFSAAVGGRGDLYNILADDSLQAATKGSTLTAANGKLCLLCDQYATEALFYLRQNETQAEILSILHHACAKLAPLKQQCITLVDYYIPLFFMEVSMMSPEKFCESVHLCKRGSKIHLPTRMDTCNLCHNVLVEVLMMLKDPNLQLEVVQPLLKTCNKAETYEQQCKQLVLKYVPLILVKGQKFLETTDVCSEIQACKMETTSSTENMRLSAQAYL